MNTRTKGFLATVVSATFFGFIPLMVKVVCSGGGNTLAAAFYRFALSLPALYIYLKVKKIPMRITKTQLRDIVLITVLGYGGTTLILFSSYNYIPLGMATTIHFTYPVFTILGCVIFLHEKIKKMKVLAVALSFGGILFFYNADGSVSLPGMALAFASGMTYAFYTIYLRESSLKDMDSVKLIFCLNTVGAANAEGSYSSTPSSHTRRRMRSPLLKLASSSVCWANFVLPDSRKPVKRYTGTCFAMAYSPFQRKSPATASSCSS